MKLIKKIAIILIIFGAISIIFLTWYSVQHKMDEALTYEINEKTLKQHVLIATQGSKFKDAVVGGVVAELKTLPVYIKVVDVSQLAYINESEWSAIVILHTWENFKPQKDAREFIERSASRDKLIVLSTSGSGTEMIEDVDGITSASLPEEVTSNADTIVARVKTLLVEK